MKTLREILGTLFLLITVTACKGQTPEQQKQIDEAEKMAVKAQQMSDSIMNTPQMKQMMEQMQAIEAKYEKERQERKQQEKNTESQEAAKTNVDNEGHLKHLIISSGDTKKFNAWPLGQADLTIATRTYKRGKPFDERTIGQINADGSFTIAFPESMNIQTDRPPVTDYFHTSSDNTSDNKTQYTGEDTRISEAYIHIGGSNEDMGSLRLATSRQLVWNKSPAGMHRGDPGYRIGMWYATDNATVKANTTSMARATDHAEIVKNIPMTKVYDLTFKPGLNFIKEEVVGTQYVGEVPYYKTMRYTTLDRLPNDVKWVISSPDLLDK